MVYSPTKLHLPFEGYRLHNASPGLSFVCALHPTISHGACLSSFRNAWDGDQSVRRPAILFLFLFFCFPGRLWLEYAPQCGLSSEHSPCFDYASSDVREAATVCPTCEERMRCADTWKFCAVHNDGCLYLITSFVLHFSLLLEIFDCFSSYRFSQAFFT